MQRVLSGDLDRVASEKSTSSDSNPVTVFVRTDDDREISVTASSTDVIAKAVKAALGEVCGVLLMDGVPLDSSLTFGEEGIEDGARIAMQSIHISVEKVARDLAELHPRRMSMETLRDRLKFVDADGPKGAAPDGEWDAYLPGPDWKPGKRPLLNWDLRLMGITSLPASMSLLQTAPGGSLNLGGNALVSLPEDIGTLCLGGGLNLYNNQILHVSGLEQVPSLRVLMLGKNHIL